jgi:multiple sugar transport system substrate-binding protein
MGVTIALAVSAATLGLTMSSSAAKARDTAHASKTTISVLYTYNYMFDTDAIADQFWNKIAKEWKKLYPNVTLKLEGTGGTDIDEMNKAAVLLRSASTSPDVIQLPTTYVGEFAASGYLAPLNSFVDTNPAPALWSGMAKSTQEESTIGGKVYGINVGNNDNGIYYNKALLRKAGIKLPWDPKNWQDILTAAEAVKKADPGVSPLWLGAGVEAGATNVLQGIGNMIAGSTTPTMYDTTTGKWVVNSPGLVATLKFYKTMFEKGLGSPTADLLSATSLGEPATLFAAGKLAIAVGPNWFGDVWATPNTPSAWAQGSKDMGVAALPTENGQGAGYANNVGGWAFAISKASPNEKYDWDLIKLTEDPANQLFTALQAGFTPPDTAIGNESAFDNFAPPFQKAFNVYEKYGVPLPNNVNFTVYSRALDTVTGDLALNPKMSMSSALSTLSSIMTQQLGSSSVETLKK